MSRLTMSPFHKSSPFEFPRAPLSPPETYSDTVVPPPQMPIPTHTLAGQDFGMPEAGPSTSILDTPSRVKRPSSIPYHNSGISRESKDRVPQRNTKTLILVIPPSTLIQDNGRLSSGPYHRLSQGVVMPLFPSMFAQLTAIAREFNFPSTTGLCLYYHYNEDGLMLTPRISDDSWQTIWAHLSEPLPPNEKRPLIGGKVEFDIDLRLARWYAAWLSAIHRENPENVAYYPSTAPSLAHFRGDSNVTGGRPFEDESSDIQQHSAPITTRHVPRKLSLVERYDASSVRGDSRSNMRPSVTPPEVVPGAAHVLSPIVQEEEPRTARQFLDNRVNSWRASAIVKATPLAGTGQTSLDPPNLPNHMPIDSLVRDPDSPTSQKELNLEEFTWSISSLGPQSQGSLSPVSYYHAPSVHLANRLEGSVCTTPSICTSFGPPDDDFIDYIYSPRVASPDIAHRFFDDSPLSPMTATSWGAPLSYPPSPDIDYDFRISTPDIAHRHYEVSPASPMTATSWGPPSSYPPSPRCISPVPSLDLGERCHSDEFDQSILYLPASHIKPTSRSLINSTVAKPWSHVWPYNKINDPTPTKAAQPWTHVWPYNSNATKNSSDDTSTHINRTWLHVWPYNNFATNSSSMKSGLAESVDYRDSFIYPYVNIYSPVYPFLDIYPAIHVASKPASLSPPKVPSPLDRGHSFIYPYINIYQPVYPFLEVYPPVHPCLASKSRPSISSKMSPSSDNGHSFIYPYINIYRPVYPFLEIYPPVHANPSSTLDSAPALSALESVVSVDVKLSFRYPFFNLWNCALDPPVYPYNLDEIYPAVVNSRHERMENSAAYPYFDLYPAVDGPRHACFSLHLCNPRGQYPDFDIYPEVKRFVIGRSQEGVVSDVSSRVREIHLRQYPTFNIYPAVYPHFDLYPAVERVHTKGGSISIDKTSRTSTTQYPLFNLYPAVYPYFDLYPSIWPQSVISALKPCVKDEGRKLSMKPILPSMYPSFNLYPSIYPFFDVYPAPYGMLPDKTPEARISPEKSICSGYPYFNLYPGVYPYFEIYPVPYGDDLVKPKSLPLSFGTNHQSTLVSGYPYFNLYPGVYPNFEIYPTRALLQGSPPSEQEPRSPAPTLSIHTRCQYPYFNLYPPVYPFFDLYPSLAQATIDPPKRVVSKSTTRLTHAELHAMVMMEGIGSQKSFGHVGHLSGMDNNISHLPSAHKERTPQSYVNPARTLPSSPGQFRESRQLSLTPKLSNAIVLPGSTNSPLSQSPSRKSVTFQEIQRSSSLREQTGHRASVGLKPVPRRRDSVVLQRARALDNSAESSSTLSRETLAKFPMPPRAPLPPLPMDRGH